MKKKNLFVTFPVDFGSASVEKNYQKIFSETFNFEYTNPGDSVCSNEIINIAITINNLQDAEAGDIDNQVACTTDGMIDLNQYLDGSGAQMGGTFSGEGVSDNMFDASIGASEEGYLITYSINGEDSECIEGEDSTTFRIFVNEPGQAVADAMNDEVNVCTSETSYNLNAALSDDSTLGGTFSLNGEELEGNIFDASTAEAGEYTFTYTVSSEDAGCIEGEASTSFTINVTSETFDAGEDVTFTVCSVGLNPTPTIATVRNYFVNLLADGVPTDGTFTPSTVINCSSTAEDIAEFLTNQDTANPSPLQDQDPYDGGDAFKSAASTKIEGDTVLTATDATATDDGEIAINTQYSKSADDTLSNTIVIE